MQIVIDISEEDYQNLKVKDKFDDMYLNYYEKLIVRGTPLPKHGRLIDVDDLLDRIGLEDNDSSREENVGEIITLEDFDAIPTIIEADVSDIDVGNLESEDEE